MENLMPRLMVQILPANKQQKSREVKALQQDVRRTEVGVANAFLYKLKRIVYGSLAQLVKNFGQSELKITQ